MEVVNVGAVLEMSKLGLPFLRKGNNPSETKAIKVFLSENFVLEQSLDIFIIGYVIQILMVGSWKCLKVLFHGRETIQP